MEKHGPELEIYLHFTNRPELSLVNKGQTEVRFWNPYNSWGWQKLKLEAETSETHFSIVQKDKIFTRNGPGYILIQPGISEIYDLQWESDNWWVKSAAPQNFEPIRLSAVFTIPETKESRAFGVATGNFRSNYVSLQKEQVEMIFHQLRY